MSKEDKVKPPGGRVAIIHDWLTGMRGGERCLEAFLALYPDADIFTLIHVPGSTSAQIDARVRQVSFLNKLPFAARLYRLFLPLYPFAIRQFDLSGYRMIISLNHAAAKNVRVPDTVPHICYCFTPMRYIWDQVYTYFGRLSPVLFPIIAMLRRWDKAGSKSVTHFVAISRFISARIRCYYGRESSIVYPPVDDRWFESSLPAEAGSNRPFLYAGALVRYKRVDLVIEAFNTLGLPLIIAGKGPEERRLRKMAGPKIRFVGFVSDGELAALYRSCRALLFPVKEDFGIVPVECMAAGRPVIGLYEGACRETITGLKPWDDAHNLRIDPRCLSGVFIKPSTPSAQVGALVRSIRYYCDHETAFTGEACRRQAMKFSVSAFRAGWHNAVAVLTKEVEKNGVT